MKGPARGSILIVLFIPAFVCCPANSAFGSTFFPVPGAVMEIFFRGSLLKRKQA